ncbi:MAG: hypothetical protein V3V00_11930 [Saprospiraceae bacterium]
MKNTLFVIILLIGSFGVSQAQDYNSAIGLRLGYPLSVTYKTFINESTAIEAFAGFRSFGSYKEFRVNAAYLIHNEMESVDRLKWYYGAGPGFAFYSYNSSFQGNEGGVSITISGYVGLEYTLDETPISFSVDWVPTLFIGGGGSGFGGGYGALAVRYVLN